MNKYQITYKLLKSPLWGVQFGGKIRLTIVNKKLAKKEASAYILEKYNKPFEITEVKRYTFK